MELVKYSGFKEKRKIYLKKLWKLCICCDRNSTPWL